MRVFIVINVIMLCHDHFFFLLAPQLRKTSKITVSQAQENGAPKESFVRPQLKPVPPKDAPTKLQSKEVKVPIKLNSVKDSPAKKTLTNKLKEEDPESIEKVTKPVLYW